MSTELTIQEFRPAVLAIIEEQDGKYNASLENHLLSLWGVIKKYEKYTPSYALFVTMLAEAFQTQPCQFDEEWLSYENDLSWDDQDGAKVSDFEMLKHTIIFQIADLHRMDSGQLDDPYKYFGINSPTGNRWYNFDAITYWECATAGMEACLDMPDHPRKKFFDSCTWVTLAKLLELGQSYE